MIANMPKDADGNPIPIFGMASAQTINGTSASAATAEVLSATEEKIVTFIAIGNCWIKWGADPTAVAEAANNVYLADGAERTYPIPMANKVAVIGGKLNIVIAR